MKLASTKEARLNLKTAIYKLGGLREIYKTNTDKNLLAELHAIQIWLEDTLPLLDFDSNN